MMGTRHAAVSDTAARPCAQAPDPVQLKGKQRAEALRAAEAAAERELAVLISDNSMTWDL